MKPVYLLAWGLMAVIVISVMSPVYEGFVKKNNVLSAQSPPALTKTDGTEFIINLNTPTPTPSPTSTPTPTPTSSPTPTSTPTPTPIPVTAEQLDGWFTRYANHYSVDRSLLFGIAVCESNLKPGAVNWIYGGLYQFSPNTWQANRRRMGMDSNPDLRFNPEESIRTAAFVLSTRGAGAWPNCPRK